jgi:ABC-type branched-subunit amino acid transport system ATPase component
MTVLRHLGVPGYRIRVQRHCDDLPAFRRADRARWRRPRRAQAIIGPNGSGKTTLLNALSGASHADAGSIRVDGKEIFRLKPHRIARLGLACTFQNIRVFSNLSVLENVRSRRPATRRPP